MENEIMTQEAVEMVAEECVKNTISGKTIITGGIGLGLAVGAGYLAYKLVTKIKNRKIELTENVEDESEAVEAEVVDDVKIIK